MTGSNLVHKAVQYQKTVTGNTFEIYSVFQNSSVKALQLSVEQCSWLPKQSRQSYSQWVGCCFTATDDLKKQIDGCYQQFEQLFSSLEKESVEPAVKLMAEKPPKTKPVASRKASAEKTKATATPTIDKDKAKTSSTSTGAANSKITPVITTRSGRKKAVTKTPRATKEVTVKEKSSPADSSSTTVTAGVKKEVTEIAQPIKEAAPAISMLPVDRNPKTTTPLVVEKKSTLKSS
jgi:hypothetical protein